jgi:hypothetical protein
MGRSFVMMERCSIEQIKVAGEDLVEQIERIVHEGNVRRIVVKHKGHVVAEFPLTAGVIGTALAPMLAAIGALVAALTHCTIEVERVDFGDEPLTLSERAELETARKELDEAVPGEPVPPR